MSNTTPKFSIILAAGKGTRMGSSSLHKVCFPIDEIPTINRAINTYNQSGIRQHVVVVGALSGQVVETAGKEFENLVFAYQAEQLGTAHAVKVGLRTLNSMPDEEDALIVAGDRLIDLSVLEQLYDLYYSKGLDLALLGTPYHKGSSQGRLILDENQELLAIKELADIKQRLVYKKLRELVDTGTECNPNQLLDIIKKTYSAGGSMPPDRKFHKIFGKLWEELTENNSSTTMEKLKILIYEGPIRFDIVNRDGMTIHHEPEDLERTPWFNTSVYLVKISALRQALKKLNTNNAQKEQYLSDIVTIMATERDKGKVSHKVGLLKVEDSNKVLGYNDPAELLAIENYIQSQKRLADRPALPDETWFRSIEDWQSLINSILEDKEPERLPFWKEMATLYSDDVDIIKSHLKNYLEVLENAKSILASEEKVFLVRSPGRVNVMGRHVDHQGGNCNLMTIGFETLMVVRPRNDDQISLYNVDKNNFKERTFTISEMVRDLPWDDWLSLVNSDKLSKMISDYGIDWSLYVQAAILRLQKKFSHTRLFGMDLVVWGNIPMAAGLSSSSSLVVGTAEAVVAVNQLNTFPSQLVSLCGEGEWFVGTRGGSADHAAVKLGQKGKVIKVTFFDFAVQQIVPFPEDYVQVVCDSGIKAQKSANAKDQFNHRISCYRIGFQIIKKLFPQYAPLLKHLRDVNTRHLGIPLSWIYRILLHLPEHATQDQLREILPDEDLEQFFVTHQAPADGIYPIRGVVLFGLAEFERARLYADYLKKKEVESIGELMDASHNGDRAATFTANGEEVPYEAPSSNIYLLGLIEDLESGDLERVTRAQLHWQPGSYHCSIPAIDRMVDISRKIPGVVGAQLAGAGLGGCMMVLAKRDAVPELIEKLTKQYFEPLNIEPAILVCEPVAGAGVLLKDSNS